MTLRSMNNGNKTKFQMKKAIMKGIIFVIPFVLAYFCSVFLVQVTLIQGDSMSPAYRDKQFVLLIKYDKTVERGDVIAFSCEGLKANLIKRIVGVPGDEVVTEGGVLYVNGEKVKEIGGNAQGEERRSYVVPADCYFVLGDYAEKSVDSRDPLVGFVPAERIIGKVWER